MVSIGTTTPGFKFQIADANAPQLALSDTSLTSNHWTFRSLNGNLYIGTSSPSTYATSSVTALTIDTNANVGIGTSSPTAQFHTTGTVRLAGFGAGALTTDANGNVTASSDERLKNINGGFTRGLADIKQLNPILYHWNAQSKLDGTTQYAGFSAQNVQSAIPEAVDTDPRGYLSLSDRPILAASINAIKELAGVTDSLSLATTSLATRILGVETELSAQANAFNNPIPQALTVSNLTASSIAANGTITAGEVVASAAVRAGQFIVPVTNESFVFGSSTIGVTLPPEVLTSNATEVDLYKLATYSLASIQNITNRLDLITTALDTLDTRVDALEVAGTGSGSVSLATSTIKNALESFGILLQNGLAQFNTLVFRQIVVTKDVDGTSSADSVVIPSGTTSVEIPNALVLPTSKIFVTFTSTLNGSWYIAKKETGKFTVELSQPQAADATFDYFVVQTEGQIASPAGVNPPPSPSQSPEGTLPSGGNELPPSDGGSGSGSSTTTPPVAGDTQAPVVTLLGDAAVQIVQGGTWVETGATAQDDINGDLSSQISIEGTVDSNTPGVYTLTYSATDVAGNTGSASRVVNVLAPTTGP
jgi:hypothetical protein